MTYAAAVKTPPATRSDFSTIFGVPADVGAVVRDFRSCELSTFARDGTPVTWPTMPYFEPDRRRFLITSSIGLAQKAFNIRRDPHVAMLFSTSTGSGLIRPPAVLIQGDGEVAEELGQLDERFESMTRLLFERAATTRHHIDGRAARSAAASRGLVLLASPYIRPTTPDPLVAGRRSAPGIRRGRAVTTWRAIAQELRRYDSAVITARGLDGYPVSVRCVPVADERSGTFAVSIPDTLGIESSPAWLLCHFHDERFWSLRSFGARGLLEHTDGAWRFRPTSFVAGMGGIAASIRLFIGGRRRARHYLAARGLKPPEVPWERITAIKRDVEAQHADGSAGR